MKIKLNRAIRVNALPCEVEVTNEEAHRLMLLGACEIVLPKETKKAKRETRKAEVEE